MLTICVIKLKVAYKGKIISYGKFFFLLKYETSQREFDIRGKLPGLDKGANIRNLICPLCYSFRRRQDIKGISDITNGRIHDKF